MRIKNNVSLKEIAIVFFFIISVKFFYLFELPTAYGVGQQILNALYALGLFLILIILDRKISLDKYGKWIIAFFAFMVLELIYSAFKYQYSSIFSMINENLFFFTLLMYFVIRRWINSKLKYQRMITVITIICVITSSLLLINAFIYNTTGNFILKIGGINYGTVKLLYRSNGIRIYNVSQGLIFIMGIISAGYVFEAKKRDKLWFLHLLNLVTMLLSLYYIEQSRMNLIIAAIAVFVTLMSSEASTKTRRYTTIALVLLLLVVFGWDIISTATRSIIDSLRDASDVTAQYRFQEISYYWQMAKSNPLFGLGLVNASGDYETLVAGPSGNWTYTDVGIFGILGKLGFTGAIFYLIILFTLLKDSYTHRSKNRSAQLGICVALLLSTMTLSYFDSQRIVGLLMAIIFISFDNKYVNIS